MERLTKRNEADSAYYYPKCFEKCDGIGSSSKCENCELTYNVCKKLGNYEDLEEQGRLIKLPCKVGDTIYVNNGFTIFEYEVTLTGYSSTSKESGFYFVTKSKKNSETVQEFSDGDFGETVFLTKSEAEAKLAEMKKNESKE